MDKTIRFYFGSLGTARGRVSVVDGDITDDDLADKLSDHGFGTIINTAAIVKHFTSDDSMDRVNTGGVANIISLAERRSARVIHVSTVSVAGQASAEAVRGGLCLHENELCIGQNVDNAYTRTKYNSEKLMLDAISRGLDGKIVRPGNIMPRTSDGRFQINYDANNFATVLDSV